MSLERPRPSCPACGAPGRGRNYRVDDYDLYRCVACRTEFLVLRPGGTPHDSGYWDAYKFEAYGNDEAREDYASRYDLMLAEGRKYTSVIREVLDVGCGIGNYLSWAASRDIHAVGAEVDERAIDVARSRGLEVHTIESLPSALSAGSMDAITLWDVIEHLVDPGAAVADLVPLLRPGGLLMLETPDVGFVLRPVAVGVRKMAEPIRYSDVLYFADHRTYFSAEGLGSLLEAHGLEVMTHFGMRSPAAKMRRLFTHLSEGRRGLTMERLYGPLDRTMTALGLTNKLMMIARRPWE